ncbi:unnamed protein product [Leptidea sinapis]|uniref:Uncharacterized protein n=1 Tax=Leptidea sinapis TaxID=189913 RepID=A0A5E4QEN8_9NEOP|nr:unnamed protein product [Leptidea sinapis]
MAAPSTTGSEYADSEMPASVLGEATPGPAAAPSGFPPYPPYATEPAPPSVADTILAGRDLRVQHKSTPKPPVRPLPRPAKPRGPKATDVKMSKRAMRAHARCLRRHGAVLTDRLEKISKPPLRSIIYLWRQHANTLPPETIARLRSMLDADEPFKPEQAYEYFINLRKSKKKSDKVQVHHMKKDILAICQDKRFTWARNATVAFARGIQQRLAEPGSYALADGMLRLSNIILEDLCCNMHTKPPSRRCTHPKAKFMMEMADKVAVWIDEILAESDDKMLMMDFDEDEEVEKSLASPPEPGRSTSESNSASLAGTPSATVDATPASSGTALAGTPSDVIHADEAGDAGFTDDFLDMMGARGRQLRTTVDIEKRNSLSPETVQRLDVPDKPVPTAPI